MAGIFDLFSIAAKGVEKVPWRWRLLGGAAAGAVYEGVVGDPQEEFFSRMAKGLFVGGTLGLGAAGLTKVAGGVASGAEWVGKRALKGKYAAVKSGIKEFGPWSPKSYKSLFQTGTLALTGAAVGAAVAPSGHRTQGAMIGAGLGLVAKPAYNIIKGYTSLGPVGKSAALIATAAIPVGASALFGGTQPETTATGMMGLGGQIDYEPLEGDMKSRMTAMNASGDIVLGMHNRKHG